ncbi:unnamed protein product [Schistosoma turkestanicum]|nr:unnamed protein product [Schistosoma turkestanicum]
MISHLITLSVTIVILWTVNVEAYTFLAPIRFGDSGEMYINLGRVNISLSSDFELTISDADCTKTLSLRPPTEEEIMFKTGYRSGSSLCQSWFMPKLRKKIRFPSWWLNLF